MQAEKWHIVGGQVYRLADVFSTSSEAIMIARSLRGHLHVVISKEDDGLWAVYWRPRVDSSKRETECCGVT